MAEIATCANPGCDQPGTKQCSLCKTAPYCGPSCQTTDWPNHKEFCPGHLRELRKIGMDNLRKATGFHDADNWMPALKHSNLALTKLKRLNKDRPLEAISEALAIKCGALQFMGRYKESLESVEERYNLWALDRGPAHPNTIDAAFQLIQSCIHNQSYVDAEKYAYNLWDILNSTNIHADNRIPADRHQEYLARGAREYARATFRLSHDGGIPPAEKQKSGEEAIVLARRSVEIYSQLDGAASIEVANSMLTLAQVVDHFMDADVDEVISLYEQSMVIFSRVEGPLSPNVAASTGNVGSAYIHRSNRAKAAKDLDRCVMNCEMALPRYREALRIYRAINHVDMVENSIRAIAGIEENLRQIRFERGTVASGKR